MVIVPAGAPLHSIAGDRLALVPLEHPYLAGIAPPSGNAGIVILRGAGIPPPLPPRPPPLPWPPPRSCAKPIPAVSAAATAMDVKIRAIRIYDCSYFFPA